MHDVITLAALWSTKHPELSSRLEKAAALATDGSVETLGPREWAVKGSRGLVYSVRRVEAHRAVCSCPDHIQRGGRCKHILAAALVVASERHAVAEAAE